MRKLYGLECTKNTHLRRRSCERRRHRGKGAPPSAAVLGLRFSPAAAALQMPPVRTLPPLAPGDPTGCLNRRAHRCCLNRCANCCCLKWHAMCSKPFMPMKVCACLYAPLWALARPSKRCAFPAVHSVGRAISICFCMHTRKPKEPDTGRGIISGT